MSDVRVMYDGIEIRYHETENVWRFELRGRERSTESLAKAKEVIDKPEPKENKFTRLPAYLRTYGGDEFQRVEITSIAEASRYDRGVHVWVSNEGKREKKSVIYLYAVTSDNDAKIAEYRALDAQINQLEKQKESLVAGMAKAEVRP